MDETPLFFPSRGGRLFGVLHRPENDDRQEAFVFCHAYAEEKLWAHRVFVSFARELAARGYTVLRFDFRGYGDSDGDFCDFTVAHHLEDIDAAVGFVGSLNRNLKQIGLVGHRLGARLALESAIRQKTCGPLILWDPITDGKRYIQDFLRSNLTTQLAVYGEIRETREQLLERMNNGSSVNVEGYDLGKQSYDAIAALKLPEPGKAHPWSRALVVQVGKTEKPKKDIQLMAERFGASLICVVEEPFWREIKRFYYRADKLFTATQEWLECAQ